MKAISFRNHLFVISLAVLGGCTNPVSERVDGMVGGTEPQRKTSDPTCPSEVPIDGSPCSKERTPGPAGASAGTDGGASGVVGQPCKRDSDCGPGTFCDFDTFGEVVCRAIRNPGSSCLHNDHCRPGTTCVGGTCFDPNVCSPEGTLCLSDANCCVAGQLCRSNRCFALRSDGADCSQDNECQTGRCTFGHCGATTMCIATGKTCFYDKECCPGNFCHNAAGVFCDWIGDASKRYSTPLLPSGAGCGDCSRCANGSCTNGICP